MNEYTVDTTQHCMLMRRKNTVFYKQYSTSRIQILGNEITGKNTARPFNFPLPDTTGAKWKVELMCMYRNKELNEEA